MTVSERIRQDPSAPPPRRRRRREPEEPAAGLAAAVAELSQAIAHRRVEAICIAYHRLREAGKELTRRQLLEAADRAAIGPGRGVIVSAFTRRHCYMCDGGTNPCGTCEGEGFREGRPCPQCDGLGVERCDFCMGSGLADIEAAPPELRHAVARRRIAHVQKALARLKRLPDPQALRRRGLTTLERRELAKWLIRLHGQLAAARGLDLDEARRLARPFAQAGQRLDQLLEALRPPAPPPAPPEEP